MQRSIILNKFQSNISINLHAPSDKFDIAALLQILVDNEGLAASLLPTLVELTEDIAMQNNVKKKYNIFNKFNYQNNEGFVVLVYYLETFFLYGI